MRRLFLFCILVSSLTVIGRSKVARPVVSRFRSDLSAIVRTAAHPSGFDELKNIEMVTGVWDCRLGLDGFLLTIVLDQYHPADRWLVRAESVTPAAARNVRMLLLKGLPGYTMKDSDTDKTVAIDRTRHSRKVVFTRKDRFTESTITVLFNAHQYASLTMLIESWSLS
ncbi:hypothetical protein GCM10023093_31050 [Nemorincola caseinilytica]|uniref:Uncharacterized protein n=1 Tax=Nemorincola caseinilytica TaxID=2054315 RepID=A0ABP8NNG4_9BACT